MPRMKLKTRIRRFFGLDQPSAQFDDPEIAALAAEKAAELRKLQQQAKVARLQAEIDQLRNPPQANRPQSDMEQLIGLFMLLKGFQGQNGEQDSMANFMSFLQQNNAYGEQVAAADFSPPQQQQQTPLIASGADKLQLSDGEIRAALHNVPADKIRMAKVMPAAVVKSFMRKNLDYDDKTIDRAVQIIKKEM